MHLWISETANISCAQDFKGHHYGMGGKCFPSSGTFKGLGQAYLDIRADKERFTLINGSIAADPALQYHGILFSMYDSNSNLYVLNYEDLTELSYDTYVTVLVEKYSTDRYLPRN